MVSTSWLSREALNLHLIFREAFWALLLSLVVIGLVLDFFKVPFGLTPNPQSLIARAFLAVILLSLHREITNFIAMVVDVFSEDLGEFSLITSTIKALVKNFRESIFVNNFTWSWPPANSIMVYLSIGSYWLAYFSIFLLEAAQLYFWTFLFIVSPIIFALTPISTSPVKALYKTIIQVSIWKVAWNVSAIMLWSTAFNNIQDEQSSLTVFAYVLFCAFGMLLTPVIVTALAGKGLDSLSSSVTKIGFDSMSFSPSMLGKLKSWKSFDGMFSGRNPGGRDQSSKFSGGTNSAGARQRPTPQSRHHKMAKKETRDINKSPEPYSGPRAFRVEPRHWRSPEFGQNADPYDGPRDVRIGPESSGLDRSGVTYSGPRESKVEPKTFDNKMGNDFKESSYDGLRKLKVNPKESQSQIIS